MKFDIISIFPEMFESYFAESILGRARQDNLISVEAHGLRQWSDDPKHQKVDDRPFGGGAGMVMKVAPFYNAIKALMPRKLKKTRVILFSAKGKRLNHAKVVELATKYDRLILLCGRYEGVDERVVQNLVDEEISIGDFVLTGGELPAMVLIDAVSRYVPGVLGNEVSLDEESHAIEGLTEYPQYTRPEVFSPSKGKKWPIPEILMSGDHKKIAAWRKEQRKKAE